MVIDFLMVILYFVIVFIVGLYKSRAEKGESKNAEQYFLSKRSLTWYAIAMSMIATNIQAGHFLGMGGSAYAYGLAQANFEIGAIVGILLCAFVFIPFYLKLKVYTLTQFFEDRFGPVVSFFYALFSIILFGIIYLGGALFWGSYAVNWIFDDVLRTFSDNPELRLYVIVVIMGTFSAFYVYFGGMAAVVRTDIVQFVALTIGSSIILWLSVSKAGGVSALFTKTGQYMHLHLPSDHPKIPWTSVFFGMMLIHIMYWGSNQVILQRSLSARSLREAQLGLIAGGFVKYLMALLIIVPPIALRGFYHKELEDPDQAYIVLINTLLHPGLRGLVLCGLFASLMSTVDSLIHSTSTMISIDMYKRHINKNATDEQMVRVGKISIAIITVCGILFAYLFIYVKYHGLDFPLAHLFNEIAYHIMAGFAILLLASVFAHTANRKLVAFIFIFSVVVSLVAKYILLPDMNYMNRTGLIIVVLLSVIIFSHITSKKPKPSLKDYFHVSGKDTVYLAIVLFAIFILLHIFFH